MSMAYRSAYQHIVGTRLAEMRLAKDAVEPLLPRLRRVHTARVARVVAGSVGIASTLAAAVGALFDDRGSSASTAVVGGAAAVVGAYAVTRALLAVGGLFVGSPRFAIPTLTGELDTDLARIDASSPLAKTLARLDRLEVYSTALPLAAISLLAPLTLHFAFSAIVLEKSLHDFADWIRISFIIVGHAHIALMCASVAFARKMKRMDTPALAAMPITREWARALGIAVLVAAMPGIILFLIPPLLALFTGLAFVPFMFVLMRRRVLNERAAMALVEESRLRVAVDLETTPTALDEAVWENLEQPTTVSARM